MKKIIWFFALLLGFTIFFISCSKDNSAEVKPISSTLNLPATPHNYVDDNYIRAATFTFNNNNSDNQTTDAGATLGRVLFYDTRLSLNSSVSCATCHVQHKAFAASTPFSVGFEGRTTKRNSPPVMNMLMHENFFWDASQDKLEDMVLQPIKNHLEMGIDDLDHLEQKLGAVEYYPPLFKAAFGTEEVTSFRISRALAQFVRSMVSVKSKYDEVVFDQGDKTFTPMEEFGFELFSSSRLSCNSCHGNFNFTSWGGDAANIGLEMDYADDGVSNGLFKVPSLRNIDLTAPYMHDGRFATLEEVIDHYDHGIVAHPSLDFRLREGYPDFLNFDRINPGNISVDPLSGTALINGQIFITSNFSSNPPKRLNLSDIEKQALIAFLNTLTDREFLTDEKFSNPFVQ